MAGVVAEALTFSSAEGGLDDEAKLAQLIRAVRPDWDEARAQGMVRWAMLQAGLLLQRYADEHDALVSVMIAGAPLGECIEALEASLRSKDVRGGGPRDSFERRIPDILRRGWKP